MPEWIMTLLWTLFGLLVVAANLIVIVGLCAGTWGLIDYLRDPAAWRERQNERQSHQAAKYALHYGNDPRLPVRPPRVEIFTRAPTDDESQTAKAK